MNCNIRNLIYCLRNFFWYDAVNEIVTMFDERAKKRRHRKNQYYRRCLFGINTGNLIGGVIGKTKFIYDVWGDTVNVASRMESTGEAMKIHVTDITYEQVKSAIKYSDRKEIEVKGKDPMTTCYL